jgi:hypothetical protein
LASYRGIQNPIIYRSNDSANLNILCLYTLTDRPDDKFDVRNLSFGNLALFITNASEFVQRVRNAAASSNWRIEHGKVQYVERATHDGHIRAIPEVPRVFIQKRVSLRIHYGQARAMPP